VIVTLCGSGRFKDQIHDIGHQLENAGYFVMSPPLHEIDRLTEDSDSQELTDLVWKGATHAHLQRVAKADIVFVVNPDGYVGNSTTLELGYAVSEGKVLVAMQPDQEPARQVLYDEILDVDNPRKAVDALASVIQRMELHAGERRPRRR
jgi:nucleoside 2-deoxyribosyltransferase